MNRFIVIEGIDGVGKSSVAASVAKKLGAQLMRTPPDFFDQFENWLETITSPETRFLLYMFGNSYVSDRVRSDLKQRSIVCDRYFASTVAYHRAMGCLLPTSILDYGLVKPDYTFFLNVTSEEVRRTRLLKRNDNSEWDMLMEDDSFRDRVLEEYSRFRMTKIDTTGLSVDEVASRITEYVFSANAG